jgi:hypothetical protein
MDGISLPNANHNQQEVQRVNNAGMVALTLYNLLPFGTDLAALAPPDSTISTLQRYCSQDPFSSPHRAGGAFFFSSLHQLWPF